MGIGRDGEELAKDYLIKKHYEILAQNYHSRFGEIDIVAKEDNCIVFVEVKTRSNSLFGTPLEAITRKKLSKIVKTSQFYLAQFKLYRYDFRIDAIEILFKNSEVIIGHVKNITL